MTTGALIKDIETDRDGPVSKLAGLTMVEAGPRDQNLDRLIWRNVGSRIFYRFCRFLVRISALVFFDYRQFGEKWVPRRGAVVVASNHQSYLDPLMVGLSIQRNTYYLARESLFRFFPLRWLIPLLNALPIPRGKPSSRRGINLGRAVLRNEKVLVLFPEGTRSRDGKMGPVKRGIELITKPTGAQVVPAFVDGSFQVWPRGGWISFYPVRVFFGPPLEREATETEEGFTEPAGAERRGGRKRLSTDLVAQLTASYRNLEAQARRVRWFGAANSCERLRYFS